VRVLSYSQISTWEQCPLKYRLEYIEGLEPPPKPYFSFGTSLHAAVEFFYRAPLTPPSRQELLDELDRVWLSEGYHSDDEEAENKAQARRILNRFWFAHAPEFATAAACEHPFDLDLGGVGLRGVIDRVDDAPDGGLHITDYKTGRYAWEQAEVEDHLQLTLYQLAAQEVWQRPVTRLTLYHLRRNQPYSAAPRDEATLAAARERVFTTAAAIELGDFSPQLGRFCPCDYAAYCPLFAGSRPIPVAVIPAEADSTEGTAP
jgi:RecB family exonuclease